MINNGTSWLTILLTAAVGVLLIIFHGKLDLLNWIILAMGVVIAIPCFYNMIASFGKSRRDSKGNVIVSNVVASVAGVALGLWMIINPAFFVGMMAYLFAVIMIVYGIGQIVLVGYMSRPYRLPFWFYIIPVILIVAGVVILCTSVHTMNSVVVLLTGIMLVLSAVNWALQFATTHPAGKPKEIEQ